MILSAPAGLPSDQREIEPASLYGWARAHVPDEAEGVFIGGNGFRAAGVIEAMEADLDRPALTANQALFWNLIGLSRAASPVVGYGRLFEQPLPAP